MNTTAARTFTNQRQSTRDAVAHAPAAQELQLEQRVAREGAAVWRASSMTRDPYHSNHGSVIVVMKSRLLTSFVRLAVIGGSAAACGGPSRGKLRVDTPILTYQKPDISEITGIDEDETNEDSGSASGSASAQPGK
jgi:hypothetical protein